MKTFVRLALILALFVPLVVHADEASRRAKVERMLTLTHADRLIQQQLESVKTGMEDGFKKGLGNATLTDQQMKISNEFMAKMQDILAQQLAWERIKPIIVKVYMDNYTEEEVDAIITFYSSPAGHSMIEKSPAVMKQVTAMMTAQMQDMYPQLEAAQKEFAEKLKAATKPAPAGKN